MKTGFISYIIGFAACFFVIIQCLIMLLYLNKKEEYHRRKKEILHIVVVVFLVMASLILCFLNLIHSEASFLYFKIQMVAGIFTLFVYVALLRNIAISIKDISFVETDGYKKKIGNYLKILFSISTLLSIAAVFFYFFPQFSMAYSIFLYISAAFLISVGFIEMLEFSRVLRIEIGKITPLKLLQYRTILFVGIIAMLSGVIGIGVNAMGLFELVSIYGDPYAYGVVVMMIGFILSFVFEYIDILIRVNETNKKLAELNRQFMDDVRTAQSLQISLLPLDKQKYIQKFIDMEISYMPMQSVGGDYYDFYKLDDNNLLIFLGDASGHGVYAAMIWAMLKVEVEELIENKHFNNLAQAFMLLNQRITRILENTYSYATLFACTINLNTRIIHFISAGHTDQLYYSVSEKTVKRIRNKNPIIGTFKNAKFTADSITCKSGDVLLLFSDGIVEGLNPEGNQLGREKLEKIFLEVAKKDGNASSIISNILIKLEDFFEGTIQKDDRTLMVIKL